MSNVMQVIVLFAVFQGLILLLALLNKRQWSLAANQVLIGLIGAICLLLGLVSLSALGIKFLTAIGYLGDSVALLYGPLFYFYVLRLLTRAKKKLWPHLLPFLLFVFVNTLWLLIPEEASITRFQSGFYLVMTSGSLIQIIVYLFYSWLLINQYQKEIAQEHSYDQPLSYIRVLILIITLCVLMFSTNHLFQLTGYNPPFLFLNYQIGWLLLSALVFVLAYYAIRQPEIFRLEPKAFQSETVSDEDFTDLLKQLTECLEREKPYLDPELSLDALAQMVACRKEVLSKAINQGLGVNFYQLINSHRIEAFEALAKDPGNKHLTHLALAMDAGFRSKTTFYKAFRELKQTTPSAYLKSL